MSFGAFPATNASIQGTNALQNASKQPTNTIFTPATATQNLGQLATQQPIDHSSHPFEGLSAAYNPNSSTCPFRCFFYNRLPANTVINEVIKPPQVSERLWQQVVDDNPRPGQYIPVMATGFQDLQERANWQEACLKAHSLKLEELEGRLERMLKDHEAGSDQNTVYKRLTSAIQRQNQLALRVIKIMRQIEVLRRAGRKLSENEQEMLKLLQLLSKKLSSPPIDATSVRVFAFQLKALTDEQQPVAKQPIPDTFTTSLLPLLNDQQTVLADLVESVNSALVDYDIMLHGYQL